MNQSKKLHGQSSYTDCLSQAETESLMAKWLEQLSQWHEMYCHGLEIMSSNPGRVKLGVQSTSVLSSTWSKNKLQLYFSIAVQIAQVTWPIWILVAGNLGNNNEIQPKGSS